MALPIIQDQELAIDRSRYDDANVHDPAFEAPPGITEEVVRIISESKKEPVWMLQKRLQGLKLYEKTPFPTWGPDLRPLIKDMDKIKYFVQPKAKETKNWEDLPEDIRKTYERIGIPEAEKKSLSGVGAQYDCLTGDSLVYTNPKGALKIKDITPGDTVFSWDERKNQVVKSKVLAFMDKGKRDVFEVNVAGRNLKVTKNHPFLALVDRRKEGRKRARYSREWRYLSDLKKGDLIAVATDLPDAGKSHAFSFSTPAHSHRHTIITIPEKTSEDLLWFLGFYLGDGFIHREKSKARLEIAIPETQPELRQEMVVVCNKLFGCVPRRPDRYRISINSTILANFITEIGLGGKAKEKRIPEWVFTLPRAEKLAFIAGYLDADGGVRTKSAKNPFFTSANPTMLQSIKSLCTYCGIQTSRITSFKSGRTNVRGEPVIGYRLHLSGRVRRIPSRHPIKKARLRAQVFEGSRFVSASGTSIGKYCSDSIGFARIKSITSVGIENVYDISVENYKNFIAEGIIVHNSDIVYHSLKKEWEDQGVVFTNMDVAVQRYPELVQKYFMTSCVPINDHKFVMLHAAVWSGGTFIYIPKNVRVRIPLQAYFRMNAERGGQFEHTLIIADEGSEVHYIEGCSAPAYESASLHAGCVELHVLKGARIRYSSVENWSRNTYNLNTKRAIVQENGVVEWINGNLGSGVTMLYPCSVLAGRGARSDSLGIAFAGAGQNQDTGSKVIHAAPNTSSTIQAKSISKDGGISTYRGLVKVMPNAIGSSVSVNCDALLVGEESISNTYPDMKIDTDDVQIAHEATVGRIGTDEIFYLMSRGLTEEQARQMIVSGFIEPIVKALPLEYAVELNKLIELEMEGSVG